MRCTLKNRGYLVYLVDGAFDVSREGAIDLLVRDYLVQSHFRRDFGARSGARIDVVRLNLNVDYFLRRVAVVAIARRRDVFCKCYGTLYEI